MRTSHPRRSLRRLVLTIALLFTTLLPAATSAAPTQSAALAVKPQDVAAPVAPLSAAPSVARHTPPRVQTNDAIQGSVLLDVSAPLEIRAGDLITYTFTYTNTGAAVTNVIIQASWTGFYPTPMGEYQHCTSGSDPYAGCQPLPASSTGITKRAACPPEYGASSKDICYDIGTLAVAAKGKLVVRLGSNPDRFPQSGREPVRPAGSGRLYINNEANRISEDTASTLIVGPVLTLYKRAVNDQPLYATESGEFIITLGNAAGDADKPGGQVRVDARPATSVEVVDYWPFGSSYISATPAPTTVDTQNRLLKWKINGAVNPGSSQEFRVTYRKEDSTDDCDGLNNGRLNVTSAEYPKIGGVPAQINGQGANINVVRPMRMEFRAEPGSAPFGGQGDLTVMVRNYWDKPLNNVQLTYDVQTNASYINGTASPAPTSVATVAGRQRLTWNFSIPAGSKTSPSDLNFTLRVLGTYTNQRDDGRALLTLPAGVPKACIEPRYGSLGLEPRLRVTKSANTDEPRVGGVYIVDDGQEFPYKLVVQNVGSADATGVSLLDTLPREQGANFSYVVGSATLNGVSRAPDSFTNGSLGSIRWQNLTIPAGGQIEITYRLFVSGQDYVEYCNGISAKRTDSTYGDEPIQYNEMRVCVKISPKITLTKTVDKPTAEPGDTVRFTLTLTNEDPDPQTVGLFDILDRFSYIGNAQGYDTAPSIEDNGRNVRFKLQTLTTGETLTVSFDARVSSECTQAEYPNEALFHNNQNNIIRPVPQVYARVAVVCGKIDYVKNSSRERVSLGDQFVYTLRFENRDGQAASNIEVLDLLPQGFSYVALDAGSAVTTEPLAESRPDGRTALSWVIPTLDANAATEIRFIARAGAVVGEFENLLNVKAGGRCVSDCVSPFGDGVVYSRRTVRVEALATMEPKLTPDTCAKPGDIRTYELTIVNTNNHDYTSTEVIVKLPIGALFDKANGTTPQPMLSNDAEGNLLLTWSNLRVLAKPDNATSSQLLLSVDLKIGQVWGDLSTTVQTSSPDGSIPRKEGVADPTIQICATEPSIAKESSRHLAIVNGELFYQISLANPSANPITTDVTDALPTSMTYLATVLGPAPTIDGQNLTWSGVSVPAANNGKAGVVWLRFKVKINSGSEGEAVTNTATASASEIQPQSSSIEITVSRFSAFIYLPIIARPE